ncbi:MAG: DNA polymerase III subunit gamma/tau [Patescibacteria group bacterium]|mgnify:FL=1
MTGEPEHLVLYRKYRPKSFAEVVGQEHIVTVLKNALRLGHVGHAYLFSGTRGTGKTTLARLLAKAYNCEKLSDDGEPCNKCPTCREFSLGRALDMIEIDAASARGIDDIRELRESVRFSPMHARRKVYIIDEVHMLTREAFNALLKTLEEPPDHAMFILATTEIEKVPDTILSRTQSFEFRPIPQGKIRERMLTLIKSEKYKFDEEGIMMLTFLADGSLRDAESMLGQLMDAFPDGAGKDTVESVFGLPKMQSVHSLIDAALSRDAVRIIDTIHAITEQGIDARMLSRLLVNETRKLYLVLINPKEIDRLKTELAEDHIKFFESHKNLNQKEVEVLLIKLLEAHNSGFRGPFQELPVELALLSASLGEEEKPQPLKKPDFLK